ncbi:MAG: SurA N-terminal domain-containing protein [Nitrospiria bacterium]
MLKSIRTGAIENPWFFRILMLAVAVVFAFSMGWWGFGEGEGRSENFVAQIGEEGITAEEYQRAYRSASKFYRELFQDEYDDADLRQRVINELIERKLWLKEAHNMGIVVADASLADSVSNMPGFQKDGQFDPERYQRVLSFERYSPQSFEAKQRELLMVEKAKRFVRNGVALTPTELKEAEESDPENPDPDKTAEDRLTQKQQRAVMAYTLALREKASILIKEEQL